MPRLADPLTELQIRKAKAAAKAYALSDGNGLSLLVSPAGRKTWSVRYRLLDGTRPAPCVIGHYPGMSLAQARVRAMEIQRDAAQGKATQGLRSVAKKAAAEETGEEQAEALAKQEAQNASLRSV